MGVGAVLALSVPFVVVLGWISAYQFEGFFLKNWRDNEKEYKIYDDSVPARVMKNCFLPERILQRSGVHCFDACNMHSGRILLFKLGFTDTNIVMIYILGVLLTAVVTKGYVYSV